MSKKVASMDKIREILRLKFEKGLSERKVARACAVSRPTVAKYVRGALLAGIGWPLKPEMDEAWLDERLGDRRRAGQKPRRHLPEMSKIRKELSRKGVTLQRLWQEYIENNSGGYGYTQFCEYYRRWAGANKTCYRQTYKAGEFMFVDFAGQKIPYFDVESGTLKYAHLFVAVLGASNYTYVEVCENEQQHCWTMAHVRAYEYFNGVTELAVPDNPKALVRKPDRYDPDINQSYWEMLRYYGTAAMPARVRKPRDKAKVESGVLVAERWILAPLRNHKFFSITQIIEAVKPLLEKLNDTPFNKMEGTRRQHYEQIDRPKLRPLPKKRYEYAVWKVATLNIDCHFTAMKHFYSAPHTYRQQQLKVRIASNRVEAFSKGHRVASHIRSFIPNRYTTVKEHLPPKLQAYDAWGPQRIVEWAHDTGPYTAAMAKAIIESKPFPQLGYKSCMGLIRMGKNFGKDRLEAACHRALALGSWHYQSVKSILATGKDKEPLPVRTQQIEIKIDHPNIRGGNYYN